MTKSTPERLSIMEEQLAQNSREHSEIKDDVREIKSMLSSAISCKANQSDVDSLNSKVWGFFSAIAVAFLGMIVWLIQKN